MSGVRCIGFGEYEGRCENVHDGALNPVWCDRCNAFRIAYLNGQFAKLSERFEASHSHSHPGDGAR